MNYRRLGATGLKVSEISIGGWLTFGGSIDEVKTAAILRSAVDQGINFIDLADIYARGEAEKAAGKAIKGLKRSDLVISSKLFWPMSDAINDRGLSRKHIMESIHATLQRLGTDYLDLYFCHRFDPETGVDEIVRAMDDLIRQGKVLYWGTSVWSAVQIEHAVGAANRWLAYPPVVEQPRYNMLDRHIESEIMPACARNGMGLVVWSPLAQGLLTGKYNTGTPSSSRGATTSWLQPYLIPQNIELVRKLSELARETGITMSQMALAWVLRRPEVSSAITGATDISQLAENVKAGKVKLSSDLLDRIEQLLQEVPALT